MSGVQAASLNSSRVKASGASGISPLFESITSDNSV
jgi:hypothetical protein